MYFVQGILGLARLALTYFFKDELHLDPVRRQWRLQTLTPVSMRVASAFKVFELCISSSIEAQLVSLRLLYQAALVIPRRRVLGC